MRPSLTMPVLAPVAAGVVAIALIAGLVATLVLSWWLGVVAVVAVVGLGAALVTGRVQRAETRALTLAGPVRAPRTGGDPAEARLLNLVEGLAPNAGLPRPRCLVVDDPVPNAMPLGRDARRGSLVVTTGLLQALSRIELEAVVAHGLIRLRDRATTAPTVALALGGGWLLRRAVAAAPDAAAVDLAAVALTRYPPGLLGALKIIAAAGPAAPSGASPTLGPLWMAPPGSAADMTRRMAALEEL